MKIQVDKEIGVGNFIAAREKIDKIDFIVEALLAVAQDIQRCCDKRDVKCIENEVEHTKERVRHFAERAPKQIREKYLPAVIGGLDTFLFNVGADMKEADPWGEVDEHYIECLNYMLACLCLAYNEL